MKPESRKKRRLMVDSLGPTHNQYGCKFLKVSTEGVVRTNDGRILVKWKIRSTRRKVTSGEKDVE